MLNFLTQEKIQLYWNPAILIRDPTIILKKGGSYEKSDIIVATCCSIRV